MSPTAYIIASEIKLGPMHWQQVREFWAFGLIPAGTLVLLNDREPERKIEDLPRLSSFPKRLRFYAGRFQSNEFSSQKQKASPCLTGYIQHLGWPFPVDDLNHFQADCLREKLEVIFKSRRKEREEWDLSARHSRSLLDSPPTAEQIAFLRDINVCLPAYFSIESSQHEAWSLIRENSTVEEFADWCEKKFWRKQPPTPRQQKVLAFFGFKEVYKLNRGQANAKISRIFANDAKRIQWEKYKRLTNDDCDEGPSLKPFDPEILERVDINVRIESWMRKAWRVLNSFDHYRCAWVDYGEIVKIVGQSQLRQMLLANQFDEFRAAFLSCIQSHYAELAERELRHRKDLSKH